VDYPSLPRWYGGLVRIPYNLPDDEALVERLSVKTEECMSRIWVDISTEPGSRELFCFVSTRKERPSANRPLAVEASRFRTQVWMAT
jgi:hypothetical protein